MWAQLGSLVDKPYLLEDFTRLGLEPSGIIESSVDDHSRYCPKCAINGVLL